MSPPRRTGRVNEYQDGNWLLYITRWDGMPHAEVEIWRNDAELRWRTTDPSKINEAIVMFHSNPEQFAQPNVYGELPSTRKCAACGEPTLQGNEFCSERCKFPDTNEGKS